MATSGELRSKGRCGVFAGKTVWSTPERLRGELLTTRRYANLHLPLPYLTTRPAWRQTYSYLRSNEASVHFGRLWPNINWWVRLMMDYPCAKFGHFSFSHFGFIVQLNRQTDTQPESHTDAAKCLTPTTVAGVSTSNDGNTSRKYSESPNLCHGICFSLQC